MTQNTETKTDSTKATAGKASKPKPYKEVITTQAVTQNGLFKVHRIDTRYYFEIPDSLLNRDLLTVNRISKAAADLRPQNGFYGYSGDEIGENVIRFSQGPNNKLFIQRVSYADHSSDSSENGMYRSVLNSSFQPIVAAFDIKTFSPDSSGVVIDVTDYLNTDNDVLFFDPQVKKTFGLGAFQADKSYTAKLSSFPQNIEICTVKTYSSPTGEANSFELNSSIVLLPKTPMKPRYYDPRVGYFATGYRDFDANPQGVEKTYMALRWRLEPKEEDLEKYKRGELVEPKKPIVFYIDPATPKKWVPYLIQGVNDWQKAFEQAGFKNAIYALEVPANDPSFSLEDARHNAIIYKPSSLPNAYGPQVHDPRSGEILEAHVGWFHNVMELVHDWYMVQAGAIDPKARKMEFDDSLMGQLIRVVSSHEIGHTLGLAHNFGSSSTVPVDSLRNKKWVEANGHTPSIMDYARFNYVAQPGDGISEAGIFPRIGVYDKWAIEWGYKWLPELKSLTEEKTYMNQWIIHRLSKDKRLWYGEQPFGELVIDPRRQSEDLGDDAMKANAYGIKNLKRIVPQLVHWTEKPGENYDDLTRIRMQVIAQYYRYLMHVAAYIGAKLNNNVTTDQNQAAVRFVSRERQQSAIQFLQDQLFSTPGWIFNKTFDSLINVSETNTLLSIQYQVLSAITSHVVLNNLLSFENQEGRRAYTINNLFTDLEAGIWKEVKAHQPISIYRRNLQMLYVERLNTLLNNNSNNVWIASDWKRWTPYIDYTDEHAMLKEHAEKILKWINTALPFYKDDRVQYHLKDLKYKLQRAIDPQKYSSEENAKSSANLRGCLYLDFKGQQYVNCWDANLPDLIY